MKGTDDQGEHRGNPNAFLSVELPQEVAAWLARCGEELSRPQPVMGKIKVYQVTPEMVASKILRAAYFEDVNGKGSD